MEIHFTVLGSGSGGNASLLEIDGFGLLIDMGLGPRAIATRLKQFGRSWDDVSAGVLTHAHSDHWNDRTFAQFVRRQIPLYCHAEHTSTLRRWSESFGELARVRLVRHFDSRGTTIFRGAPDVAFRAFRLSHDSGACFGFRIERRRTLWSEPWSMAYAADLGTWRPELVPHFADADLVALEFNHDVELERSSGRPADLVRRVLGDQGHLSNDQAGDFLRAILRTSHADRVRHVVQLHLSQDCNDPDLARRAALRALDACGRTALVRTAHQTVPVRVTDLPGHRTVARS